MTTSTNANAPRERGVAGTPDDTPSFSYPPPASVKGRLLASLLRGRILTSFDVWREMGSSRASHHVHVLRSGGWPIRTDMRTVSTSDGRREEIVYYSLPAETIGLAGERGQEFAEACARIERERRAA